MVGHRRLAMGKIQFGLVKRIILTYKQVSLNFKQIRFNFTTINGGNVGIGTTSPGSEKLYLFGWEHFRIQQGYQYIYADVPKIFLYSTSGTNGWFMISNVSDANDYGWSVRRKDGTE